MTWKRAFLLLVCGACVLGIMNCEGGKYADAKRVTIEYLNAMEKYVSAVEEATSAKALVRAVDDFVEEMIALRPEMEAIEKKYPELTDMSTAPAEMEDLAQRMDALSPRLVAAQDKLMQYAADPDIQSALQKLQNTEF